MEIGIAAWLVAALSTSLVTVHPVVNLHARPAVDAEVVSQAIYGNRLQILEEKTGWIRVRTSDGYTGWARRGDMAPVQAERRGSAFVTVDSLFANLYAEPSISKRAPLLMVPYETRLEVVAEPQREDSAWIQVYLAGGGTAWVERENVTTDSGKLNAKQIAMFARRFLGLPYLWGGVSTFGYDCSGFVQMLCRRRAVSLPRDAREQVNWEGFEKVESRTWRPGDVLYFGQTLERVTHAGLYIGGGRMIHAAPPYIRIQAVDEVARTRGKVYVRRLK